MSLREAWPDGHAALAAAETGDAGALAAVLRGLARLDGERLVEAALTLARTERGDLASGAFHALAHSRRDDALDALLRALDPESGVPPKALHRSVHPLALGDPDPDPMRPWGWVPAAGPWAPGEYTLTRVDGVESSEGFTVESFGVEPVPAEVLVGRAWRVRSADAVSDLDGLALSLGVPLLVIEGAAAGEVQFAELLDLPDSGLCVSLRDVAAYDEGRARLEWAWPEATFGVGAESLPVEARDLWLEVWFSPDRPRAAARAHGEVDTRHLALEADLGEESGMCQLLASFGLECHECPDGEWLCRREDVDRIELLEEPAPDLAALPMCGLDRVSIEVPEVEFGPIGCDGTFELDPDVSGDCGCAMGSATTRLAMPGLLALVAALRRRSYALGKWARASRVARDRA